MSTKRKPRTSRASRPSRATKGAPSVKRVEDAVCAVCGKFYPGHRMSWHSVDRKHDGGRVTREKILLCDRDAEKTQAGEHAHLTHIEHHGSKSPHLHVPSA